MEFRYRAVDQRPPEHNPYPPSLSNIHPQATGAGLMNPFGVRYAPDMGFRTPLNAEQVPYDAIQRQLEKQRIREEIILFEIERRRMLELEVRREMEQEMIMHRVAGGFPFEARSRSWSDRRFSFEDRVDDRFMREPWATEGHARVDRFPSMYPYPSVSYPKVSQPACQSEDSKDRVIMLAKPTPNLSGLKRKLDATPPRQSSPRPTVTIGNKRAKEEHCCALCQVSATSAKGLDEHLQGKKHKMMVEQLRTEKTGGKKSQIDSGGSLMNAKEETGKKLVPHAVREEADEKSVQQPMEDLKDNNGKNIETSGEAKPSPKVGIRLEDQNKKQRKRFRFWCKTCGVGAYCETVFESHMKGKKHRLNVRQNEEAAASDNKSLATSEKITFI